MRILRTRSETVVLHCLHPSSNTRRDACFELCTRPRAWRSNVATSLRIFARVTPEALLSDKNFSASGQAASNAPTRDLPTCRRSAQMRRSLHRLKKNSGKEVLFRNRCCMGACIGRTCVTVRGVFCLLQCGALGWLAEKKMQKSVDSKKKRD